MHVRNVHPSRPARRGRVMALHCSGAGAGQWSALADALAETMGDGLELIAPEHFGTDSTGPWTGAGAFSLADEAARTIALIDACDDPVHLVGHSYGGGVALEVALARPRRIASMALYEPSAFYLLRQIGSVGIAAFAEIAGIARRVSEGVAAGDHRGATETFVNYWSGPGAWARLRPQVQAALVRWSPKAPLDFHALIEEPTPIVALCSLDFPVLVLRGEHAPLPTRVIAETLPGVLRNSRLLTIAGAGHMGPLTHAREVAALVAGHIAAAQAGGQAMCGADHWLAGCEPARRVS